MSTKTKTKTENDPCALVELSISVKLSGYLVNNYDEFTKLYTKHKFVTLPSKFPVFIQESESYLINEEFDSEEFHYNLKPEGK